MPERHETLGPDLATAHFVVARRGAVKLEGSNRWISQKSGQNKYRHSLPTMPSKDTRLEAVDVSDTDMMYTSFDNFSKQSYQSLQSKLVFSFTLWSIKCVSFLPVKGVNDLNKFYAVLAWNELLPHTCCIYTVFQKKTPTHIVGYKWRNSCLILIIFDIKIPDII